MGEIVEPKYLCDKCHRHEAKYDFKEHQFVCEFCDHIKKATYKIVKCPRCSSYGSEYTWFDPGRCSYCGYSYTD